MSTNQFLLLAMEEERRKGIEVCLWMSFSNENGFAGVIITKTLGLAHAIEKTHQLGINPSGSIQSVEMSPEEVNPDDFDRLLSYDELVAGGYILARDKMH